MNSSGRIVRDPSDLQRCSRCLLPETHETIIFDDDGVCNVCLNQDIKHSIDWDAKRSEFEGIVEEYRGKYDYDCIVPFSGGKDSTIASIRRSRAWNEHLHIEQSMAHPDYSMMRLELFDSVPVPANWESLDDQKITRSAEAQSGCLISSRLRLKSYTRSLISDTRTTCIHLLGKNPGFAPRSRLPIKAPPS
jgi:hypothetical protein